MSAYGDIRNPLVCTITRLGPGAAPSSAPNPTGTRSISAWTAAIPPEVESGLFNPFKRSSLNNPRNRTGMGLGLYIAQQIVHEHQGEIDYRHVDGAGSGRVVFTVRLPLA